jgi:hypothetical protein
MSHVGLTPKRAHLSRLLALWRSAGWPCHDTIELDLVAAGWVTMVHDTQGRHSLQLTASGIALLAASRQQHQRALSAHDRLAARLATQLCQAGRLVWRELSLRAHVSDATATVDTAPLQNTLPLTDLGEPEAPPLARLPGHWRMARPDVFSVRRTTVEAYLQPVVHEIKVSRADLLSDLRDESKRMAYQWLSCETYYVMPMAVAQPSDIPAPFGVWWLHGGVDDGTLEMVRPAQHTPCKLPLAVWMAMAQAAPFQPSVFDEDAMAQAALQSVSAPGGDLGGDPGSDGAGS